MQKDNLTKRITKAVDAMYYILINRGAIDRLAKALENVENGTKSKKNITFVRITEEMLEEINIIRELQGQKTLTKRNVTAFSNTINKHLGKHIIQRLGSKIAARREGQDPHRRLGKT